MNARTLVLGGLAIAAAAGAMKNRHRVAGLIGARSSEPAPYPAPQDAPVGAPSSTHGAPAPEPVPSNYDASGPPENTATPVPAPDPVEPPAIDEAAEEQAAAAEAANIGGPEPEYAGSTIHQEATEEERPLAESGEGVAEGQEQAEADLADNAEPSAGDPIEGGRQIEDTIERQDEPGAGEIAEPLTAREETGAEADQQQATEAVLPSRGYDPHDEDDEDLPAADAAGPSSIIPGQLVIDPDEIRREGGDEPTGSGATPPAETGDTLAPGSTGEGAPSTGGTLSGTTGPPEERGGETPAAEKSSAVWRTEDQPTVESPAAKPEEAVESAEAGTTTQDADDDDDGGSEWQTWSGQAIQP